MTEQEAIEQAKDEIKHIRQIIREQAIGWRGVAEPHFRKALALLEQLVPQEAETPAVEPIKSFVLRLREVACGQNTLEAILLNKACDRLYAQQQEIEKLKEQKKPPSQERFEQAIVNEYAAKTWEESYKKEADRLASANKAQAERIEKLENENAKLRGEVPLPDAWWEDCPALAQRTMERIMERNDAQRQQVDHLTAENAKLKEELAGSVATLECRVNDVQAQAERIEKLEKAVSLLNSMVLCRDDHSVISRQVVEQALKGKEEKP